MPALGAGPRGVPAAAAFQRQRGRPGPPVPAVTGLRRALQAEAGFASCVTQEREQKFPDERPGLLPPWPHGACYSACPSRGACEWRGRTPPLLPSLAPLLPCSEASPSGGPPAGHRRATGTVLQAVSCQIATCNGLFSFFTFFRCISSFFESVTIDWVTSKYLSLVRYGAEQNRTSLRSRGIDQLVVGR